MENKQSTERPELRDLGQARAWAVAQLHTITDRPHLEAELLLAHILGRPRTFLIAHPEVVLAAKQAADFAGAVQRRATGEPLPYITGQIEFFGIPFTVTPAVLIPRPETELLVETALAWIKRRDMHTAVDVGTGSGCIAVTLALHAPMLHLYANDISAAALEIARANAARHGVGHRITFLEGDLLAPVSEPVDLIISNPPYVADREWAALPVSVKQEPRLALLAGEDGLDTVRRLLEQAHAALRPNGVMLMEIGEQQGKTAKALAQAAFPDAIVRILPDLAAQDRVLEVVLR